MNSKRKPRFPYKEARLSGTTYAFEVNQKNMCLTVWGSRITSFQLPTRWSQAAGGAVSAKDTRQGRRTDHQPRRAPRTPHVCVSIASVPRPKGAETKAKPRTQLRTDYLQQLGRCCRHPPFIRWVRNRQHTQVVRLTQASFLFRLLFPIGSF